MGSTGDKVLSCSLQEKLSYSFKNPKIKIFDNIAHEDYFCSDYVINYWLHSAIRQGWER